MRGNSAMTGTRRRARLLSGGTLVAMALGLTAFGLAPAAAQEDPGADPGGDPEAEGLPEGDAGEPIEISASTLYVSPATGALPPTLTNSVPPAAICVVAPQFCPGELDPVRSGAVGAIKTVQDQGRDFPVQPVPADSAAVSFLAGVPRYQTAILFDTPSVPEGEDVMLYELTFQQGQPSYDMNSPSFRRAILGTFETIGSQDPAKFGEGLAAALTEEDPIDTSKIISIEACPLLGEFEPQGAPQAKDDSELPQQEADGDEDKTEPAVDCTFGGNGVYDEEADVWRIDLAFTAQAWADGEIENHGVLLRPIGAPNLAFGDADTTTNAQLVLELDEVTASMETMEAFEPGDFGDFDSPEGGAEGGEAAFADEGFDGGDDFAADSSGDFDAGGGDDFGAPADSGDFGGGDDEFAADAPEVADDLEGGEIDGEQEAALDAQAARPAGTEPFTPWWVWLVAPLLIGGAYLTGSAVMAPAPIGAAAAGGGGGALTRMLEKRAANGATPSTLI
jgi:hypothetical protein